METSTFLSEVATLARATEIINATVINYDYEGEFF